jgi:uncharacterized protein (TIGR02271 family)
MRWERGNVHTGMFVMGTQGERIGKVIRCDPDTFVVEKGVFFPKDYELRYDHIADMKDGTIVYSLTDFLRREESLKETAKTRETAREAREPLREAPRAAPAAGIAATTATAATAAAERTRARAERDKDEIHIPLMKEEIDVEKVARESGHVRIHKTVRTEEKHFTVPITREEVVIEHVAVARDARLPTGEVAFQEQTVDVPLHEEELRVSKRPVLREEVVIRTVAHSVDKEGSATLRHEEAEVEDTRKTAMPGKTEEGYTTPGFRR